MTASSALASIRRVRVGSANGPKIEAVSGAIRFYAPDAVVEGSAVDSGVSDQPVGFQEIALGARNRAARAFALGNCDLAVGYEDGLVELPELAEPAASAESADFVSSAESADFVSSAEPVDLGPRAEVLNIGCAAVTDGKRTSIGLSSGFAYPPETARRAIDAREPIGDLFDALWRDYAPGAYEGPSALVEGNVGKLSLGGLTRGEYARHAVMNALMRFLHPELYSSASAHRSVA